MAHKFHCPDCGAEVADCGLPENHEIEFSFSSECCGKTVTGTCGEKPVEKENAEPQAVCAEESEEEQETDSQEEE